MFSPSKSVVAAILTLASAYSFAQSANEQRCQTLNTEVQNAYKKAMQDRLPTSDPSSAVQQTTDVKGIMSVDTSAGFSKLISAGFNKLLNNLIQKGLDNANSKASAAFNQNVNGILSKNGLPTINYANYANPVVSQVAGQAQTLVPQKAAAPKAPTVNNSNPYTRN